MRLRLIDTPVELPRPGEIEEWHDVPDTNGRYQVSNLGNVRSFAGRSNGLVLKRNAYLPGYMYVNLHVGFKMKRRTIHELVALVFHGPRPEGKEVRHLDGDRLNCRADNLMYGTHSENMLDLVRHRAERGEK
jgi:hypothetical protein